MASVRIRKSNLTFDRWQDFRSAVNQMIDGRTYQRLVSIHAEEVRESDGLVRSRHRMHGTMLGPVGFRRFLPWHRAYLIAFERELRAIDDTLALPYWDWDNDQGRLVGFRNFLAMSNKRDLGLAPGVNPTDPRAWFSSENETESLETLDEDYYAFTQRLELRQHNAGHRWIGGDMVNGRHSPNDIVFWMHHATVDRVWAKWQTRNKGKRALLTGREARLDPWGKEFTVETIDNISALGNDSYSYEDPARPAPLV